MNTPVGYRRRSAAGWRLLFTAHPEIWITFGLFFVSCLWRGLSGWYTRRMSCYYDEMVYWSMARSIFHGHGLMLYELPTSFDKFIYSLVISPVFLIANSATRMKALVFLNSVLISSSLFPAWILSRRMTGSRKIRVLSLILFCLWPDLFYAHTGVMAENLYLPLSLWLLVLHVDLLARTDLPGGGRGTPWGLAVLSGILTYVAYLVKAGAAGFAAAFLALMLCRMIRPRGRSRKVMSWTLLAYLMSLLACELLRRLLMGSQSAYDGQVKFQQIASLYRLEYFAYAMIFYGLYLSVSWFFFPAILPLSVKSLRNRGSRAAGVIPFLFLSLLMVLAGTVFSVILVEHTGMTMMRVHSRYFITFSFPMLLGALEMMDQEMDTGMKHACVTVMAALAIPFLFLPRILTGSKVDSLILHLFMFQDTSGMTLAEGAGELKIHQGALLVKILYMAFASVVTVLVCRGKRKAALGLFCAFVMAVSVYNDRMTVEKLHMSGIPLEEAVACAEMDQDIAGVIGEEPLLVIVPEYLGADQKTLDTYLSMEFSMVTSSDLCGILDENHEVDLSAVPLPAGMKRFLKENEYREREYPYVLCPDIIQLKESGSDLVRSYEKTGFSLYRLRDPSVLSVSRMYPDVDEPVRSYDFERTRVLTDNVKGCFEDEGRHAWAGRNAHVRMLSGKVLYLKLATAYPFAQEYHPVLRISVNGIPVRQVEIRSEETVYSVPMPESVGEGEIMELDLECDASFVPAWYDGETLDTRSLSYMIRYIGVDPLE